MTTLDDSQPDPSDPPASDTLNRAEGAIEALQDSTARVLGVDIDPCIAAGRHLYDEVDHNADYCSPRLAAAARAHAAGHESERAVTDVDALPHNVAAMRRFFLWRSTDITEVTVPAGGAARSVATGVVFADGRVALWWAPPETLPPTVEGSIAIWTSIDDLQSVHLHRMSQTRLVWVD